MLDISTQEHNHDTESAGVQERRIIGSGSGDLIVVTAEPGQAVVDGEGGDDRIYGSEADDRIAGGPGNDFISGGDGEDFLRGDAGADVIFGGAGWDFISGDGGDDFLSGGSGGDWISGGGGDDIIIGGTGDDMMIGGDGNDTFVLRLGDGRDRISTLLQDADSMCDRDVAHLFDLGVDDLGSCNIRTDIHGRRSLVIRYGESDQLIVEDHGRGGRLAIDMFRFSNGTEMSVATLLDRYCGEGGTLMESGRARRSVSMEALHSFQREAGSLDAADSFVQVTPVSRQQAAMLSSGVCCDTESLSLPASV